MCSIKNLAKDIVQFNDSIFFQTANPFRKIAGTYMTVKNSSEIATSSNQEPSRGMVLPFQPLWLAFNHISYYVDMPTVSH